MIKANLPASCWPKNTIETGGFLGKSIGTNQMQSHHNSALPSQRIQVALSFFCIAAFTLMSTGCSTLPLASTAGTIADAAQADAGQYQVRMETFGGAKTYKGTIDGPLTIQTALELSLIHI